MVVIEPFKKKFFRRTSDPKPDPYTKAPIHKNVPMEFFTLSKFARLSIATQWAMIEAKQHKHPIKRKRGAKCKGILKWKGPR